MQYIIVCDIGALELTQQVNLLLKEHWKLYGALIIKKGQFSTFHYFQVMVREQE